MGCNKGTVFNVEKVKRLMVEKGWTYADMACACGCERSQISNILRVGRCRPNTLKMIADALGVDVIDILPKQKEEKTSGEMKIMLDDGAKMPTRAHDGDAGLDLYTMETVVIPPGCYGKLDTGCHVAIPKNHVGLVTSKSSLMMQGITCRGTIDHGFTGSIKAVLFNHSDFPIQIDRGQKITQLVILPIITPTPVVVDSLEDTERGSGGFGSTGKF